MIDDEVWVFTKLRGTIERLTGDLPLSVPIGLNTSTPVTGATHIWFLNSNRNILNRVATDGTIQERDIGEIGQEILSHKLSGKLYVVTTSAILEIDVQSLEVRQRIPISGAVGMMHSDENYLWAKLQNKTGIIRLNVATGVIDQLDYPDTNELWITPRRAWIGTTNAVVVVDKDTLSIVGEAEITDASTFLPPQSDNLNAWFALPERNTVYLINEADGSLTRELSLCSDFLAPVYDGARMWVSCIPDNQLMSVPAQMVYFGERSSLDPLGSYPPYLVDDVAWFVQRGTGRIHAYDMREQVKILTFDPQGVVLPPVYDAPYLWTVVQDSGELIRLDTSQIMSGEEAPLSRCICPAHSKRTDQPRK